MFVIGLLIGGALGTAAGFVVCALLTFSRHIDEEEGSHARQG
jgi:hypothetical protein